MKFYARAVLPDDDQQFWFPWRQSIDADDLSKAIDRFRLILVTDEVSKRLRKRSVFEVEIGEVGTRSLCGKFLGAFRFEHYSWNWNPRTIPLDSVKPVE